MAQRCHIPGRIPQQRSVQPEPEEKSLEPSATDRTITKPDGTIVEIRAGGETVVKIPSGEVRIYRTDGSRLIISAGGEVQEKSAPRKVSAEERPLNVVSFSSEEIGKLMSNFAETPFTVDGERYASVEAFYVCLKISDPKEKSKVRRLSGKQAKAAGQKLRVGEITYRGKTFPTGSQEHHEVIKTAIRAKLLQNPELARSFAETHPRPITHNTGRPERATTTFPAAAFVRILTELREELRYA